MSWKSLTEAAKYARVRKADLKQLIEMGRLRTYPSLGARFFGRSTRVISMDDIDALIRTGRAPEGADGRELRLEHVS